ncbi:MAG: Ig-like domain-containing protein [Erysipelotrichaceae bacterium]|jgi:M6 family metalloprotease-like protein|nr:Ig-like domain-containing protein [Erysipelotrichaceae bacterium]
MKLKYIILLTGILLTSCGNQDTVKPQVSLSIRETNPVVGDTIHVQYAVSDDKTATSDIKVELVYYHHDELRNQTRIDLIALTFVVSEATKYTVKLTATDAANNVTSETLSFNVSGTIVPVTGVRIDVTSLNMNLGDHIPLGYTIQPSNATNKRVTFLSENPSIAVISSEGLVTANAVGNTNISVTTVEGNFKASVPVSVINNPLIHTPTSYTMDIRDINHDNPRGLYTMSHTGNQKLLVIPVKLTDGPAWTTEMLNRLNKAFFAESSETSWESVASYYRKSSYGHLNFTGTVTAPFNANYSNTIPSPTPLIADYHAVADPMLLQEYDTDKDGFVDAPFFIYSSPHNGDNLWAWCSSIRSNANLTRPEINLYQWASYEFIAEGYGPSGIDAHTYIHETGHMLGLDDYYDYDRQSRPAGRIAMMDNNIGDHDAFSKMALEWTFPKVVTGSTSVTLAPFADTGDCLLIKNNWNGSPLDEYLLVQFITPTGLNYLDQKPGGYPGNGIRGYSVPGIMIWHVDARVIELNGSDGTYITSVPSVDEIRNGNRTYAIAASNTWSNRSGYPIGN